MGCLCLSHCRCQQKELIVGNALLPNRPSFLPYHVNTYVRHRREVCESSTNPNSKDREQTEEHLPPRSLIISMDYLFPLLILPYHMRTCARYRMVVLSI